MSIQNFVRTSLSVSLVCFSFWQKTPHLLSRKPYCLTNGMQFNHQRVGASIRFHLLLCYFHHRNLIIQYNIIVAQSCYFFIFLNPSKANTTIGQRSNSATKHIRQIVSVIPLSIIRGGNNSRAEKILISVLHIEVTIWSINDKTGSATRTQSPANRIIPHAKLTLLEFGNFSRCNAAAINPIMSLIPFTFCFLEGLFFLLFFIPIMNHPFPFCYLGRYIQR